MDHINESTVINVNPEHKLTYILPQTCKPTLLNHVPRN